MATNGTPLRLYPTRRVSPKISHEQIADHIAEYVASGKQITVLPSYTDQPTRRVSYHFNPGLGHG